MEAPPSYTDGLSIPFALRGFEGVVTVSYGPNTDPESWGFGLLHLPFELNLVRGFPVCGARVQFSGPGYYAVMDWLQLITVRETDGETRVSVDLAPNVYDLELPFCDFGHLPTMFDAPGPNPPHTDEIWLAD